MDWDQITEEGVMGVNPGGCITVTYQDTDYKGTVFERWSYGKYEFYIILKIDQNKHVCFGYKRYKNKSSKKGKQWEYRLDRSVSLCEPERLRKGLIRDGALTPKHFK